MLAAPIPENDQQRLKALRRYRILDTPPEPAFDALTRIAAHIFEVPIALVSIVDADRQWFKARYGLDVPQTPREVSFCGHVVAADAPLVVPDATKDPRFADNPLVTGEPHVRFYAGYPLRTDDGFSIGTLCVVDRRPREATAQQLEMLDLLARQTVDQLELRRKVQLLAEQEGKLQAILDSALDAVLTVDEGGLIQSVNPAACEIFGYELHELVGRNVSMLMSDLHRGRHDGYVRSYLATGVAKLIGQTREIEAVRKNGTRFPIEISLAEVQLVDRKLFTGVVRDITQRKEAQRRLAETLSDLRKSHDDLVQVLNQLPLGTLVVEGTGNLTFVSQPCRAIAEIEPREAVGKRWDEALVLDQRSREMVRTALRLPEAERDRLTLSVRTQAERHARRLEIDVHDDPRDPGRRILFLRDVSELFALQEKLTRQRSGQMVGNSAVMHELYAFIDQVAAGDWTVLVEGETGAGKELVARAIHAASPRRDGPYVTVNCAGLTDSLLGSQLFGHVKGAFTGATSDQQGLFQAAVGGTIFLDEIGDVSMSMQSALLRVLQEKEITRIGETRPRKVDVRIIAATNQDLQKLLAEGRFRQDLLYRIRGARVRVPPLRDRREDIPLLVAAFLAEQRVTAGKLVAEVSPEAMELLAAHAWPGNVRELRGAVEHAVIRCQTRRIEVADLPPEVAAAATASLPLRPPVDEKERILEAIARSGGNKTRAAQLLGIGRATLYRRIAELGIE